MPTPRRQRLLAFAIAMGVVVGGGAGASALRVHATPQKATAAGVGAIKLGKTYTQLRAAHVVGRIRPGCELAGPNARSATLRAPLRGSVDFSHTGPRRVVTIAVTRGAAARGVGIGASTATILHAFPAAVADHSTDAMFAITLVKIPASGGGRLQFAVSTKTKRVTLIGIPNVTFCE